VLRLEKLSLKRGSFALQEIDLEVAPGEYFCLLGPTGSGKTMLVECIAGLNRVASGRILLENQDITHARPEQRRVGYVPQDYALFPHMTVAENIKAPCRVRRLAPSDTAKRVEELSELLHISHLLHRYPHNLSGGEKQRVALARALSVMPRLLLLDEPFSALDQATRLRLWTEMKALHQQFPVTTIHVTHHFEEAAFMAARLGVLEGGRLRQTGSVEEVLHRPVSSSVARFVGAENIFLGVAAPEAEGCTCLEIPPGVRLKAAGCHCGKVSIAIRPEQIMLADGSERKRWDNCFPGSVAAIMPLGSVVRLIVDIGVPIIATINYSQWSARSWREGAPVTIIIPPQAIHVIEED